MQEGIVKLFVVFALLMMTLLLVWGFMKTKDSAKQAVRSSNEKYSGMSYVEKEPSRAEYPFEAIY